MSFPDRFKVLLKDPLFTKTHFPDVEQPDFESADVVYKVIEKSVTDTNATLAELFVECGGAILKEKLDCKTVIALFLYYYLRDFCDEAAGARPLISLKSPDERAQIFGSTDTLPVNGEPDAVQQFVIANLDPVDDPDMTTHIHMIAAQPSKLKLLNNCIAFYKEVSSLASPSTMAVSVSEDITMETVDTVAASLMESVPLPPAPPPPPPPVPSIDMIPESFGSPLSLTVEVIEPVPAKSSFWGVKAKPSNIFGASSSPPSDVLFVSRSKVSSSAPSSVPSSAPPAAPPSVKAPSGVSEVPFAIRAMIEARRLKAAAQSS